MQASTDRIQVTQAGSLPRTDALVAANAAREFQEDGFTLRRTPEFDELLEDAVTGLVRHQLDVGLAATAMKIRVPHGCVPCRNHITKDRMP